MNPLDAKTAAKVQEKRAAKQQQQQPAEPPPRGLRTTALDTIAPLPVRWLVPDYLPQGKLVLIAGDGGHGKTMITLHLTACLTTGRPCLGLGYDAPPPCDVLIASCEDDFADTVVPRLATLGADRKRVRRIDGITGSDGQPYPFSLAHYKRLEEMLADNPEVRLVIIDPAGAYIGGAGVDDHKDSELRSLLGPLAELAAKHKVTILLVKHLNKGSSVKAVHKVGGSAGYVNAVRAAFVVAPDRADPDRKLFLPLKFNIAKKPAGLMYRLESLTPDERAAVLDQFPDLEPADREQLGAQLFAPSWEGVAGEDADSALGDGPVVGRSDRVGECADWLAEFLGEHQWPDVEVAAAAERAGYSEATLRRAKKRLRDAGRLRSRNREFGGGWWNWLGGRTDPVPRDRPEPAGGHSAQQNGAENHAAQNGKNGADWDGSWLRPPG